jgi:molybdate transport system substrate-binding protein
VIIKKKKAKKINQKKRMKLSAVVLLLAIPIFFLSSACGTGIEGADDRQDSSDRQPDKVNLTISAAASLKDALLELQGLYAEEKPEVELTLNFGSSGSLQKQIEEGAEVDIFISAAEKQMKALQEKGLIDEGSLKTLLGNSIVLVIPSDADGIKDFGDLSSNENIKKIALGEPGSVPAGQYGEEALKSMGSYDSIKSKDKFVYGKDVKEVLVWVATGNADAGIVYKTDAKIDNNVKIIAEAPAGSYTPVVYPAAVIKETKNIQAAKDFMDFMCNEAAGTVFEKYGFTFLAK